MTSNDLSMTCDKKSSKNRLKISQNIIIFVVIKIDVKIYYENQREVLVVSDFHFDKVIGRSLRSLRGH